ncbi:MAG TPA: hypothetical protein VMR95_03180 [Candidatus Binatia bacterium]|nr:hypothetical protein [Candidatus Binatia bacterium]
MTQIPDDYELRIIGPDNIINLHDLVLYASTVAFNGAGIDPRSVVTEEWVDRVTKSVTESIGKLFGSPHLEESSTSSVLPL